MSLTSGTRLGAYEVVALLGAGGMGEVYRARDSRLQRDVAIKILPAAFAADAERLARFAREAQVLASLNHPHIAHVYGFDGGSTSSDPPRLVMELVDGPTLADRIARGPNPPWTTRCRSRDRSGMRWRPPAGQARAGEGTARSCFSVRPDATLMAVDVRAGAAFEAAETKALFTMPGNAANWDVTADGRRFLVAVPVLEQGSAPVTVVLNWREGLKP